MKKIYLPILACLAFFQSNAQLSFTNRDAQTIDFDLTKSGVNEGQFAGTGFSNTPAVGQLHAGAWAVTGMSDNAGLKDFDEEIATGDYARGVSSGGVTTGGLYAFETSTGNFSIGFQPTAGDFNPGTLSLKIINNTGEPIRSFSIKYKVLINNNENRSSLISFSHSDDNASFTNESSLDLITEEVSQGSINWIPFERTININLSSDLNDGEDYILRWRVSDVGGSGSRDEIAIDDINITPHILSASQNTTNNICADDTDGSVEITISGGTSPYTYLWESGNTTDTETGLTAGVYSFLVTVSDNTPVFDVFTFDVTITSDIEINNQNVSITEDLICYGASTTVSIDDSQPYILYTLRNDADNSIIDGPIEGTGSAIDFNTGAVTSSTTYHVHAETIIYNAVDLPNNNDYIRFDSPYSAYGNEITIESWVHFTGTNHAWAGQSSFNVDNASTNVWLWHDGIFYVNDNGDWRSLNFPTVASAGWKHVATVANASGLFIYYDGVLVASNGQTITSGIRNNSSSVVLLGQDPRFATAAARNSAVSFDNFRVWNVARTALEISDNYTACLVGDETGLVQYTLFNEGFGTDISSITGSNGYIVNSSSSNWVDGSGYCDISFDSYCELTMSTTVSVDTHDEITVITNSSNVVCYDASDGMVEVVVSGGLSPYTYLWNNNETTAMISNLDGGVYEVTITDANNCSVYENATILEPFSAITVTVSGNLDLNCSNNSDGQITLSVSGGGSTPYTYVWSNGSTTNTITGLTPGVYHYTVSDDFECSPTGSVTITSPEELVVDLNCNPAITIGGSEGSSEAIVSGGITDYTYMWSDGQTSSTATGLSQGTYTVTVVDDNGCSVSTSCFVAEDPCVNISITSSSINVSCFGGNDGEASVSMLGSFSTSFTYLWSNGNTNDNATNLTAGNYFVTVTDEFLCTATSNEVISQPVLITATDAKSICQGQSIFLGGANQTTAGNYVDTYTSLLSGCDSVVTTSLSLIAPVSTTVSASICQGQSIFLGGANQTAAGTYVDTHVSVLTGCDSIVTTNLTVNAIPNPTATTNKTVMCPGETARLTAGPTSGGNTFAWGPAGTLTSTSTAVTDASPSVTTTYTVTVTNTLGCTNTASVTVNTYPVPVFSIVHDNFGSPDCVDSIAFVGGLTNTVYTITSSNGNTFSSTNTEYVFAVSNVDISYNVSAVGASGCSSASQSFVVVGDIDCNALSVEELSKNETIKAFISNNNIQIQYQDASLRNVKLFDISGRLVYQGTTNTSEAAIPAETLQHGMYILNIVNTNNESVSIKLIK
jgi:hypothetical protein